ncbi:MAG: IS5/IS1182 family transposase, partial [Cyanobacteria bacterium QH_1_48_107]
MGQLGFWDREKRQQKLDDKKPLLQRLNQVIPWQEFPPLLEQVNHRETTS